MSSSRFPPGAERSQDSHAHPPTPWQSPHTSESSLRGPPGSSDHDNSSHDSTYDSSERASQASIGSSPRLPPPPVPSTASTPSESLIIISGSSAQIDPLTAASISSTSSQTPISPSFAPEAASIPLPASPPACLIHSLQRMREEQP